MRAVEQNEVHDTSVFTIDTGTDVVSQVVDRETGLVDVEMGTATFEAAEIPTVESVWGRDISMPDGIRLTAYTMGIITTLCCLR